MADELLEAAEEEIPAVVSRVQETRPTPKQALRNDHLAPVALREFAA
jgi:hypothetical protein